MSSGPLYAYSAVTYQSTLRDTHHAVDALCLWLPAADDNSYIRSTRMALLQYLDCTCFSKPCCMAHGTYVLCV